MAALPNVPNAAYSCMCFDEYRTEGQVPCVNGCISMPAYLNQVSIVARPPCNDPSTGSIRIPGEQNNGPADLFTTEKGKQFVHSLFAGVYSLVKEGKYLRELSAVNIYVSREGNVKFHNVEVLDQGTQHQRANRARQNYHQACQIAKDIFTQASTGWGGQIPCDLDYLFSRVMEDKVLHNIGLYHIHMSLVPIGVGMLAYFKMYDHYTPTMDDATKDSLLDKLAACQEFERDADLITLRWVKEVRKNSLLNSTYVFDKSVNYIVTDLLIKKKTRKSVYARSKMSPYEQDILWKRTEVALFLDFLRHRTAHRMQKWLRSTGEYTPEESDYACLAKFRLFLAVLQWELWKAPGFNFAKLNFPGLFGF